MTIGQLARQLLGGSLDAPANSDEEYQELLEGRTYGLLADVRAGDPAAVVALGEIARLLEDAYGASVPLDGDIEVSFLLHFYDPDGAVDPVTLLGPKLRSEVMRRRDWRARPADMGLVRAMVAEVPALQQIADDNTYGLAQDVLVHQFLFEVVQRQAEQVAAGDLDEARRTAALAERMHSGAPPATRLDEPDVGCDNTLAAGYVESFPSPDEPGAAMVDLLGPKLRPFVVLDHPSSYALGPDGELVHLPRPPAADASADPPPGRDRDGG